MKPHTILHLKKGAMIRAFAECGNVRRAANMADIGRRTHYDWLRDDADYVNALNAAREVAGDNLIVEASRRARHGLYRLKFYNGKAITDPISGELYTEHRHSDALLIFLLKRMRPEKYWR